MSKNRLMAYFYIIAAIAIWGVAGPVIKYTLEGIDPLYFLSYRFSISAFIALVYFIFRGSRLAKLRGHLGSLTLYGIMSTTLPLTLLFVGLDRTNVLTFTIMTSTIPLVTAFFGHIFLQDRVTHREKKGMAIAFLGTLITVSGPLLENSDGESRLIGNLLIFSFILVDSYSYIIAKKLLRKNISGATLSNFAFLTGFLTLVPVILFIFKMQAVNAVITLPLNFHLGVFYMAIFSGTIAYAIWNRGQRSIEVSEAAVFKYLDPLFAVPLAVLWLGESITPIFLIGSAVIALGVFVAEFKPHK